ncbi:hypothetical protein IHE45_16G050900 [Dioscorea alata]|uniref:Uncharacterized protein n=1 Tax=Dioscorea alata TaxID=55571 RepID=A0ACB7UHK0_DIOAL|nr:hypothetical protein IHE45_16G050900 [Dioscorea alata]
MSSRPRKSTGKRPREPTPPPTETEFSITEHQVRFERLSGLRFGKTRYLDLSIVRSIQGGDSVADEIGELLSVGSWERLMVIRDSVIRPFTLEVLASFEFDRGYSSFTEGTTVQFRALGRHYSLSMSQFSIGMGLYEEAFTETEEYSLLPTDYPGTVTPQQAYSRLCGQGQYEPGVSKASCLSRPAYRCLHAVMSRSISGRGDSTGVLSRQELLYLYSMVESEPLHLGHIVADYIRHQGQYPRVGVIFAGPYITRLLIGLGLRDGVRGAEKTNVPVPLGTDTLRMMGMIRRGGSGTYTWIIPHTEQGEGSRVALEPPPQDTETEVPPTAPEPPPVRMFSPSRGQDRLERLESAVGILQTEVAEVRATQITQHQEVMAQFQSLRQIFEQIVASSSFMVRPRVSPPPPSPPTSADPPANPEPPAAPEATTQDTDAEAS